MRHALTIPAAIVLAVLFSSADARLDRTSRAGLSVRDGNHHNFAEHIAKRDDVADALLAITSAFDTSSSATDDGANLSVLADSAQASVQVDDGALLLAASNTSVSALAE